MNSKTKTDGERLPGRRNADLNIPRQDFAYRRAMLARRRRMHDPMLVLNMSIFNFAGGWNRTFNELRIHEDVT